VDGVGKAAGVMNASASPFRACLAVIGSVVCFALLIETAGLIPAVIVTVVVASRGSRDTHVREAVLFGVCLAVAMSVLFVVLLNQPLAIIGMW
jgi:putative tricarboxylic transport membrane protein